MGQTGKKTILDFLEMKRGGDKMTFLTAYDFHIASIQEQIGVDMILVGDSVGMAVYGYSWGTIPVTMDQMIYHTEAVRRGAPNTFIIGDMPFLSYHESTAGAVHNAGRFYKEAGVDAIKLEGGKRVAAQIRAIVDAGMVVMGHIGLTPQSSAALGGFKAQGNTAETAMALLEDAKAVQEAGAALTLIEAVPAETGKMITETLRIPVIGIGAGPDCDGQAQVYTDAIGLFELFIPKFVKKYADAAGVIRGALKEWSEEVREGKFPASEHCYKMKAGEAEKLEEMLKKIP